MSSNVMNLSLPTDVVTRAFISFLATPPVNNFRGIFGTATARSSSLRKLNACVRIVRATCCKFSRLTNFRDYFVNRLIGQTIWSRARRSGVPWIIEGWRQFRVYLSSLDFRLSLIPLRSTRTAQISRRFTSLPISLVVQISTRSVGSPVCVCLCLRIITFELNNLRPRVSACWFAVQLPSRLPTSSS